MHSAVLCSAVLLPVCVRGSTRLWSLPAVAARRAPSPFLCSLTPIILQGRAAVETDWIGVSLAGDKGLRKDFACSKDAWVYMRESLQRCHADRASHHATQQRAQAARPPAVMQSRGWAVRTQSPRSATCARRVPAAPAVAAAPAAVATRWKAAGGRRGSRGPQPVPVRAAAPAPANARFEPAGWGVRAVRAEIGGGRGGSRHAASWSGSDGILKERRGA